MILMAYPLAVGNAVRLTLELPSSVTRTRVLRAERNYISGVDDPDAVIVADGDIEDALDTNCENGTQYWYRAYHLVANAWTSAGELVRAVPEATYIDNGVDAFQLILERIKLGIAVEVARGDLTHERGEIQVLSAPPVYDDAVFPVISVHLGKDAPGERYLSETIGGDGLDLDSNEWVEQEGWLASYDIQVVGWTLNADQRVVLRQAIKRVLVANLAVFDYFGIVEFTPTASDVEDFDSYDAPVYETVYTITCKGPVAVGGPSDRIRDVTVHATSGVTA